MATLSVLLLLKLTGAEQAAPPGESTEKASELEMASRGERKLVREINIRRLRQHQAAAQPIRRAPQGRSGKDVSEGHR